MRTPMKKALKFEWSEDMEKDFKELRQSLLQKRSRHIQILTQKSPSFSPQIALNIAKCWYTVSKTGRSGAFYWLLGQEMQPIRETFSIYEGRTADFSEEYGAMEAYCEVLAPLFSSYI